MLNGSSAVLIGSGLYFIKRGRSEAHKRMMLAAFVTSTLFLISYLYYHLVLRAGVTHFQGQGIARPLYFTLLISHTILAAVVVPFILITLARALKGRFAGTKPSRPTLCHLDVRFGDRRCYLRDAVQNFCTIDLVATSPAESFVNRDAGEAPVQGFLHRAETWRQTFSC